MRRTLAALFALLWVFCLCGCSNENKNPTIEAYTWRLTTVQEGQRGEAVACDPQLVSENEGARALEMLCTAQNGELTLTDRTNRKSYKGRYSLLEKSPDSFIYEVTIEDTAGYAVTGTASYTAYEEEEQTPQTKQSPRLIYNVGGYALNFCSAREALA